MTNTRHIVLRWVEQEYIAVQDIPRALRVAGVLPARDDWRRFLDRLLLWMGTTLIAAALIFFLAYNWNDLGHYAKFSMAEALVVAALMLVWRKGPDNASGKAALFAASLFVGALLALIGQTYQTGADTFELFGAWAALILPWVLVGQAAIFWLLWLALVNLSIVFYLQAFPNVFGMLFIFGRLPLEQVLWVLLIFNTAALAVWEVLAARGIAWLRPRLGARLLITASGSSVTMLVMMQISNGSHVSIWVVPAWLLWLVLVWAVYRRAIRDLFALAGGVLSVIVVVASLPGRLMRFDIAGVLLLTGLIVIALTAAGGWWLKSLAAEDEK